VVAGTSVCRNSGKLIGLQSYKKNPVTSMFYNIWAANVIYGRCCIIIWFDNARYGNKLYLNDMGLMDGL
jgi:hypothetical protein